VPYAVPPSPPARLDLRGDLVEQFVDSDECWSAHVPMRLFHLGMKINRRCQVLVQKFD
jgi:hypothetical protein